MRSVDDRCEPNSGWLVILEARTFCGGGGGGGGVGTKFLDRD